MNRHFSSRALLLATLAFAGCGGTPSPGGNVANPYDDVPAKREAPRAGGGFGQIDVGSYKMTLKDTMVAWMFAVQTTTASSPQMVEYWGKGSSWPTSLEDVVITADTMATCKDWRDHYCAADHAATYYLTSVPLTPPSPDAYSCDNPGPATKPFLWQASIEVADSSGTFAWILDNDGHEVWFMSRKITRGGASTFNPGTHYSTCAQLKDYTSRLSPRPTLSFTPSYVVESWDEFCANPPPECQ